MSVSKAQLAFHHIRLLSFRRKSLPEWHLFYVENRQESRETFLPGSKLATSISITQASAQTFQDSHANVFQIARYGINSQIGAFAYDPVQSLLAVGTNDSKFGAGQVYVFGQKRVFAIFSTPRKASITTLQFCVDKLICVDSKNDLCVFSLESKRLIMSYAPPGRITAVLTDPTIDYALLGLQNGKLVSDIEGRYAD